MSALVAFAVLAVTGGVFYAQSGSDPGPAQASLILSQPDLAMSTQEAPEPSPTDAPVKKKAEPEEKPAKQAVATSAEETTEEAAPKAEPKPKKASSDSGRSVAAAGAASDRIKFGQTYTGIATFYGATGAGNCSYEPTGDLMVAAMNQQDYEGSQACGAFVDVTGPKGNTVRVKIVDRCPECAPGHIDLSAEAFAKLAEPVEGRIDISWKLVSPSLSGPVKYVYKEGSTQWWCSIQVRNHRNPIRSVELKGKNGWITLPREMHNYFTSAGGEGCGGEVRITDVQGNRLTDSGIKVTPNQEQAGAQQLPAA
ncbi:expansin EXLX1 family cellulose-binding protein [Kineosporia babensis]|uniref:RlpA-like protein double-psi beta-barrel domain-containing protein n=1 Tax=Kineosporia babensis TaxID=499548 RepID=A0A9X1NG92_9ACTN|nr:hypothetical protein [Kineosporia babensis]